MDSFRVTPPGAQYRRPYDTNFESDVEIVSEPSLKEDLTERRDETVVVSPWGIPRTDGKPIRWFRKILFFGLILSASLSILIVLFTTLPKLESLVERGQGEQSKTAFLLKIPTNMDELRLVRATLALYQRQCSGRVLLAFGALYLFFQTFIIPGCLFLAILAGSMFGFYIGFTLIIVLSVAGSSFCFLLSQAILKDVLVFYFPQRCDFLSREVQRHRSNLFNYVLCIRIVPVVPSWFVNVASPVVGVPLREFVFGTLIGNIPITVICVKAGGFISQLNSVHDLYDTRTIFALISFAAMALSPVFLKNLCGNPSKTRSQVVPTL